MCSVVYVRECWKGIPLNHICSYRRSINFYDKGPNYEVVDGDIILYDEEEYLDEAYSDAVGLPSRLWPKVGEEVKIPYTLPEDNSNRTVTKLVFYSSDL